MTLNFLSIFILISFSITLIVQKIFSRKNGILLDSDFSKPQAFHKEVVARSGGIASVISLILFICIHYLIFSEILYEYIFICLSLFFIGYLDDIKIKINPITRLILMTSCLIIFISVLPIKIYNIDLIFLDLWLESNIFSTLFILLCFLFIVNGANLIDGFNGLLAINLIIINSILLSINMNNNNFEFSVFLISQIIILLSFLLFNFPKAKIFFGDSGSYLMGSLIALNTIFTNNLNPKISSFFFCIILFYLFFEVFFSFFRKILYVGQNPLLPDRNHLHMLIYKFLTIKNKKKIDINYKVSIYINSVYILLIIPSLIFINSSLFSRYYFFCLLIIYVYFYKALNKKLNR